MARPYQKKNQKYWDNLSKRVIAPTFDTELEKWEPQMLGEPLISFESTASRLTDPNGRTSFRKNRSATGPISDKYSNIDEGILPFEYNGNSVSVTEAIILCQKAYFNIPVFKSTIDLLSEFSDTDLFLEKGNAASRKFINLWLKKININNIKEQFFREFYRSGNAFFYRLDGGLQQEALKLFDLPPLSLNEKIPVKYILLNPSDIVVNGQLSFGDFRYAKALTPFEIERLKKADTPEAKEIYNSLDEEIKKQLSNKSSIDTGQQILLELDPNKFHVVFYKKQDYEPLSIPLGFCVLDDINKKIEFKKIDQAIARSIENVILLVTMGNEPDKGGINDKNMAAMREIFENKSVGRVLISDYTTSAEFIIPDLKKVISEEKYKVLNQDIHEGLGNILLGESKYSDTELKLKLFFYRLEAGKQKFLTEFLQPEINKICKKLKFRDTPNVKFVKEDVLNSEKLQKLVTRMIELGVLTPEQGIETIHKGDFPEVENMLPAQKEWKEQRLEGLYAPMISSINFYDPLAENEPTGRPSDGGGRGGKPKDDDKGGKPYVDKLGRRFPAKKKRTGVSHPSGGRPATANFSSNALFETIEKIKKFRDDSIQEYAKAKNVQELNPDQSKVVADICSTIIVNSDIENWHNSMAEVIIDPRKILGMGVNKNILEVGETYQLDDYSAAILYHSTKL